MKGMNTVGASRDMVEKDEDDAKEELVVVWHNDLPFQALGICLAPRPMDVPAASSSSFEFSFQLSTA